MLVNMAGHVKWDEPANFYIVTVTCGREIPSFGVAGNFSCGRGSTPPISASVTFAWHCRESIALPPHWTSQPSPSPSSAHLTFFHQTKAQPPDPSRFMACLCSVTVDTTGPTGMTMPAGNGRLVSTTDSWPVETQVDQNGAATWLQRQEARQE